MKDMITLTFTKEEICCLIEHISLVKISDCSMSKVQPTYTAFNSLKHALLDSERKGEK